LKKSAIILTLIFLVLLLDQSLKIWVKTSMVYNEYFTLLGFDWARIHFVENNGMAFGISLGGEYGKLALSLFRIVAVGALAYYIRLLLKAKASLGILISFALIFAGAVGNILDSAFYGLIFSESYHGQVAQMFPEGGGYAGFLHGKVVDMLNFPMFSGTYPDWIPFLGSKRFTFFSPVFNLADSSITIGVLYILIFQRKFFKNQEENQSDKTEITANTDGEDFTSKEDEITNNKTTSTDVGGVETGEES
jgi:signal peptidase II